MFNYVAVPDPKFTVGLPCSYDAIFSHSERAALYSGYSHLEKFLHLCKSLEREPFGGSISASVHFGGSNSACVHFGGSCLLKGSRSMRYREFGVSSLSDLSGIMTLGMYTEHALPTIWQQYH